MKVSKKLEYAPSYPSKRSLPGKVGILTAAAVLAAGTAVGCGKPELGGEPLVDPSTICETEPGDVAIEGDIEVDPSELTDGEVSTTWGGEPLVDPSTICETEPGDVAIEGDIEVDPSELTDGEVSTTGIILEPPEDDEPELMGDILPDPSTIDGDGSADEAPAGNYLPNPTYAGDGSNGQNR